jgi:hypothetical protein
MPCEEICDETCCDLQTEVLDFAAILECEDASGLNSYIMSAALMKMLCQSFIVYDAWTPVFDTEQQGNLFAFKVIDWICAGGNCGTKPDVGYLSPSGIVSDWASATKLNLSVAVSSSNLGIGTVNAASDLTSNRFVHINSGGTLEYADSSTGKEAHGFIETSVTTGNPIDVYVGGNFSGFAALTPGTKRYLSTNGTTSATAPVTPGHLSQHVMTCKSATEAFIDIEESTIIP